MERITSSKACSRIVPAMTELSCSMLRAPHICSVRRCPWWRRYHASKKILFLFVHRVPDVLQLLQVWERAGRLIGAWHTSDRPRVLACKRAIDVTAVSVWYWWSMHNMCKVLQRGARAKDMNDLSTQQWGQLQASSCRGHLRQPLMS